MARLNLTLDDDTLDALNRHARQTGKPAAAVARQLLRGAIAEADARERARKLARDYAAGAQDAAELLEDLELPQLDLVDDE